MNNLSGYDAVTQGVAFYELPGASFLSISGDDRVRFLQRQTTNDIELHAPDRVIPTALTSSTARILDVFYLVYEPKAIDIVPLPGHAQETAHYLKSRIFFMDRVGVADLSADYTQILLEGPATADLLHRLGFTEVPALNQLVMGSIAEQPARAFGRAGLADSGYHLVAPVSAGQALADTLKLNYITLGQPYDCPMTNQVETCSPKDFKPPGFL
jgi:folate-binding Fe-S cluster repair protein YgfZ